MTASGVLPVFITVFIAVSIVILVIVVEKLVPVGSRVSYGTPFSLVHRMPPFCRYAILVAIVDAILEVILEVIVVIILQSILDFLQRAWD